MNILSKIIIAFFLFISFFTNAQSFNTAVDYLEFIGKEQKTVTKNTWKYTKAIAHSKSDKSIAKKREVLIKTVERAIAKIEKANGFDGDTYKNNVLKHMRLNESLLKKEYADIIDMKAVAEQSYDLMEAYILAQELADEKMMQSQIEYEKNLYAFANKNKINIIESENDLGKKMEISNQVFDHSNALYLTFFKVYINEVYLWEAVEKSDVSGIQQNSNALNQAAKEGLKILDTIKPYKNDKSLILAYKTVFNFFIEESENKIPIIADFLILKEDFETIKTAIDKTPENKRTKDQIDAYNKKTKEINKAGNNYNKVNSALNSNRQKVLIKMEEAKSKFLARHVPND
ncbi:hypothetical protein [Lacinutrix venerupis]|uniref:PilJ/NarX-like methyl-accepting chemotaxis transducer n=1 Tax=Lacinutrix venerupis TaxID=1486034 RepID=A0AAC9PWY8_9FLAO|nr:hypothetical protein [Lacinutrix venerupis]APX99993.1 hypothetical protein BWR22_06625 [Lacinutrix venerupis]